jgi:hypothetical protein
MTNGIKNTSPPPVNPRHSVPVTVTPISIITQNDNNNLDNVNNKTTNFIATKTSITTTTTTTEQLNSIVRRTPTPLGLATSTNVNGYQSPSTPTSNLVNDEPIINNNLNSNHKLRSWSGTVNTNRIPNENNLNIQFNTNGNKLLMERTSTPDHFNHGHLTNWKSTAATSSQSDKQIVIDHVNNTNANEIKIQPRESFQYNTNNVSFKDRVLTYTIIK